jgi:signal transduction histidine kinase/ActR/RegA family two-component response regulator
MLHRQERGTPARHSLTWRLPAMFALLIGGVLLMFVWVAHRTLEQTLVEAGGARLTAAAGVIAQLLERGAVLDQVTAAASEDAVGAYLAAPTPGTEAAARAQLATLTSATSRRVELRDARGTRVLEITRPDAAPLPPLDEPPQPGVGPLRVDGETVYYDVTAPAGGGLGLLTLRAAFAPTNPEAARRLVGEEAVVLLGNRDGSVWFDLARPVRGPSARLDREGVVEYRSESGGQRVGVGDFLETSPWIAWVELPRATVVRAADAFLVRMIPVGLTFLAIGAALAWLVSARVTRPIAELSAAAEAVAAGNYSRRLDVMGRDEVARLAQAFNVMTAEIEESRLRLEARVDERTAELAAARAEADAANRAKSEFLSLMSHDLRTPLNAVLGFAQLLESDDLSPEQAEHVSHILSGGRHLLALISDVLDITRIESGQLGLSVEPVAVRDLVLAAADLVRPLAQQRGITIEVEDVFDEVAVDADGQRLNQILLNLLSNAVKYNRENGTVTISGRPASRKRFRITVTDTGIGLSESQMALMFRPFERLGAEQTAVEGTGLGLALSRALADAMGGSLGVSSAPGRGSTFWVELARSEAEPAAPTEGPAVPHIVPTRGGLVLYIEDNLSNVRLLQRILQRRPGVTLLHAPTGERGVAQARERRPDIVLIDLHLPDTTGEQVLRQLTADAETRDIPKIVVTADATPGLARRLEAEGAMMSLTKPLNVAEVLRLVDRLLERWNGEGQDV